ncbi:MAG: oligosaccharide flippase family protein [Roseovarius sp.]|nr:oligosaccharide flippase family protein [Roseovarius sp.]
MALRPARADRGDAEGMRRALSAHRRFPLYSTWDALATNASTQVPVLLIATFAIGPEAGFLMLAMRVVGAPLQMIGNAVSQVYLSEAAASWRRNELHTLTKRVARNMFLFVSVPVFVGTVLAAPFFGDIFGEHWKRSGEIALWLAPMMAVRAIVNPISMVMNVVGKQRQMMMLKFLGFSVRSGAVVLTIVLFNDYFVEIYAIASFFLLVLLLVYFWIASTTVYGRVQ